MLDVLKICVDWLLKKAAAGYDMAVKMLVSMTFSCLAILKPTFPFAGVVVFAILLDCASAYDLNRRLKKQFPEKVVGKFQSHNALKMFHTFGEVYSVIVLLYLVDNILLKHLGYLNLSEIGAAVFCGLQVVSILENISSGNGARWAKILQKVLVDKSKRHFNVDLNPTDTKEPL